MSQVAALKAAIFASVAAFAVATPSLGRPADPSPAGLRETPLTVLRQEFGLMCESMRSSNNPYYGTQQLDHLEIRRFVIDRQLAIDDRISGERHRKTLIGTAVLRQTGRCEKSCQKQYYRRLVHFILRRFSVGASLADFTSLPDWITNAENRGNQHAKTCCRNAVYVAYRSSSSRRAYTAESAKHNQGASAPQLPNASTMWR